MDVYYMFVCVLLAYYIFSVKCGALFAEFLLGADVCRFFPVLLLELLGTVWWGLLLSTLGATLR